MAKFDAEGFIRDLCSEIQKEIVRMELIDTGALLASPPELAKRLPTGMIPFAFIRRVIYNKDLMTKLVEKNMTN